MGVDIYVAVEHRDKDGVWHMLKMLVSEPIRNYVEQPGSPYIYRNYQLFGVLQEMACNGLPKNASPELIEKHNDWAGFDYGTAHMIYGDIRRYYKKHKTVLDLDQPDEQEEPVFVTSPLKFFLKTIKWFVYFCDPYMEMDEIEEDIRVTWWFDH